LTYKSKISLGLPKIKLEQKIYKDLLCTFMGVEKWKKGRREKKFGLLRRDFRHRFDLTVIRAFLLTLSSYGH
jgi:hypothetical protein